MVLKLGNVLGKKNRRDELRQEEGEIVLKEFRHLSIQQHADQRLFRPAYALAIETQHSVYDCLYLALAEVVDERWLQRTANFTSPLLQADTASDYYGSKTCLS